MFVMDHVFEVGLPFEGEFRVGKFDLRTNRYHDSFFRVRLEDVTGTILGYCWPKRYRGPNSLAQHDIVRVRGALGNFCENWQVNVEAAEVVEKSRANPALFVHADLCSRHDLLEQLARVVGEISSPALKRFIRSVIEDNDIMSQFVRVPSSVRHHHNYPSGNLEHSLECAEVVRRMPALNDFERGVGVIAALFHDLAKIRTNKEGGLTNVGHWVHHNALTLEILGQHLKCLDRDWPEAGNMLRHIWTSLHQGPTQPRNSLVGLVAYADQYSVECWQEKAAFAGEREWRTAAKDPSGNLRMRLRAAA